MTFGTGFYGFEFQLGHQTLQFPTSFLLYCIPGILTSEVEIILTSNSNGGFED